MDYTTGGGGLTESDNSTKLGVRVATPNERSYQIESSIQKLILLWDLSSVPFQDPRRDLNECGSANPSLLELRMIRTN